MKKYFVLSVVILLGLLAFVVQQSAIIYEHISTDYQTRVKEQFEKIRIIDEQLIVMHQRQIYLRDIALTDDVFERDELSLRHAALATKFIELRQAMLELPLSDTEKQLIEKQVAIMQKTYPLQIQIIDDLIAEREIDFTEVRSVELKPALETVNQSINAQRKYIRDVALKVIDEEHDRLQHDWRRMMALYVLMIMLIVAAAVAVYILQRRQNAMLEQAYLQVQSANKEKSRFLSSMSHELRTPLNAIIGFSDLLTIDPDANEKAKQNAGHILKAGEHLLTLIDEVLDLARVESGRIDINMEEVSLQQILEDSISLIEPVAEDYGVSLELSCNERLVIESDYVRLKQCLINLLSNACKYNRESGSIHVYCEKVSDKLRIYVEDEGAGLTDEQINKLFIPFERLGAEFSEVSGTGIGLTITAQLMKAMSGRVGVKSESGQGSTFWLEVPIMHEQKVSLDIEQKMESSVAPGGQQGSVVYVEDNAANRELMADIISGSTEYTLEMAADGIDGLQLIISAKPSLVLLDLHLPGMSGYEILNAMKREATLSDIPVIAVTANAMPDNIEDFDAYVIKPFKRNELLEQIHRLMK